jgi:hypothetical protein
MSDPSPPPQLAPCSGIGSVQRAGLLNMTHRMVYTPSSSPPFKTRVLADLPISFEFGRCLRRVLNPLKTGGRGFGQRASLLLEIEGEALRFVNCAQGCARRHHGGRSQDRHGRLVLAAGGDHDGGHQSGVGLDSLVHRLHPFLVISESLSP